MCPITTVMCYNDLIVSHRDIFQAHHNCYHLLRRHEYILQVLHRDIPPHHLLIISFVCTFSTISGTWQCREYIILVNYLSTIPARPRRDAPPQTSPVLSIELLWLLQYETSIQSNRQLPRSATQYISCLTPEQCLRWLSPRQMGPVSAAELDSTSQVSYQVL